MERLSELQRTLLALLAESTSDFRTTASLARQAKVSSEEVAQALAPLASVRRPILARGKEHSWHRLANRGMTRREKYRFFVALASRTAR